MKKILQTILRWFTVVILWKYKPTIIVITGSVGKTSTKEAISTVLDGYKSFRSSYSNYNNEIGVPLTVIGTRTGGKNILRWSFVFLKALLIFVFPWPYPEVLVLEVGANRPGDIVYLMSFVKPKISLVTAVGLSHLEFFGSLDKIAREKAEVVNALPVSGTAVLNNDDENVRAMKEKNNGTSLLYGQEEGADLKASSIRSKDEGLFFKVEYMGTLVPFELPGLLGKPNLYAALAAAGVGISQGMNLVDIAKQFQNFRGAPGRLRVMGGVKKIILIDDTYNSAPASAVAALEVLAEFPGHRKIAVLGDMEELGDLTEDGHRQVGVEVVDRGINYLFTVGPKAKFISDQARQMGYPEDRIKEFESSDEARKPVEDFLEPGDVVLLKGSQKARMEKIVKEIMAEPWRAEELLCRQDPSWKKK